MKNAAALSAVLAFASSVSAHMFISSPSPIAGSAPKNPLDPSGSDFPCHGVALPGSGGASMPVGSSQVLAFDTGAGGVNTAVHGGGSCQISITYETDAQKIKDPSNWKVLYSILGGCPSNTHLNMDGSFQGANGKTYTGSYDCSDPMTNGYDCVNSFNFTIPQGVKTGQATLAWTWFNNVGNREMYMNCVAVDITGGASDASQMAGLPNMFVANLASVNGGTCKTSERQAVQFPNPGAYLTTKKFSTRIPVATASDYPLVVPSGCGNVVDSPSAPSQTAGYTASRTIATTLATTSSKAGAAPGSSKTTTTTAVPNKNTSTVKTTTTTTTTVKVSPSKAAGSPSAGAAQPTTSPNKSSCATGSVPCTKVNSIVCVDATHFGICDTNNCAVTQSVAPGTMCINGAITWATTGKAKRHLARHMHGRHA